MRGAIIGDIIGSVSSGIITGTSMLNGSRKLPDDCDDSNDTGSQALRDNEENLPDAAFYLSEEYGGNDHENAILVQNDNREMGSGFDYGIHRADGHQNDGTW